VLQIFFVPSSFRAATVVLAFLFCERNFFELRLSLVIITEMVEDKKSVDPTLAGFYKAMERTNVEKSLMKC
jgi:hypothetical protein